jgi:uncharacterized NAD(P)/FAD-binding protein YdhS
MRPIKPQAGIEPVSEFREEPMVEEIELLSDVRTAIQQVEAEQGLSNRDAKGELRRQFGRPRVRR